MVFRRREGEVLDLGKRVRVKNHVKRSSLIINQGKEVLEELDDLNI